MLHRWSRASRWALRRAADSSAGGGASGGSGSTISQLRSRFGNNPRHIGAARGEAVPVPVDGEEGEEVSDEHARARMDRRAAKREARKQRTLAEQDAADEAYTRVRNKYFDEVKPRARARMRRRTTVGGSREHLDYDELMRQVMKADRSVATRSLPPRDLAPFMYRGGWANREAEFNDADLFETLRVPVRPKNAKDAYEQEERELTEQEEAELERERAQLYDPSKDVLPEGTTQEEFEKAPGVREFYEEKELNNLDKYDIDRTWERMEEIVDKYGRVLPRIILMSRTVVKKKTKIGNELRARVMLVAGDGKGLVGWGIGKAPTPAVATVTAYSRCMENALVVPLNEGRTLPHSVIGRFKKTKVIIRPNRHMYGMTAAPSVYHVLRTAGVQDATAKIIGPRNMHNVVLAIFDALRQVRSRQSMALARGFKTYDYLDPGDHKLMQPDEQELSEMFENVSIAVERALALNSDMRFAIRTQSDELETQLAIDLGDADMARRLARGGAEATEEVAALLEAREKMREGGGDGQGEHEREEDDGEGKEGEA